MHFSNNTSSDVHKTCTRLPHTGAWRTLRELGGLWRHVGWNTGLSTETWSRRRNTARQRDSWRFSVALKTSASYPFFSPHSITVVNKFGWRPKRVLVPQQNEVILWRQQCVLRCCPSVAKRGNIVARRADTRNVSEDFQKHRFGPAINVARVAEGVNVRGTCPRKRCWRHMVCPRFAGALVEYCSKPCNVSVTERRDTHDVIISFTLVMPSFTAMHPGASAGRG